MSIVGVILTAKTTRAIMKARKSTTKNLLFMLMSLGVWQLEFSSKGTDL